MWNLRILEVVNGFPPQDFGGVEILTRNIAMETAKRHEVHVLFPRCQEGAKECHVKSYKDEQSKIEVHEIVERYKSNSPWRLLKSDWIELSHRNCVAKKFEELLKVIKPDIVHFQHLRGLSVDLPFVAKRYCSVVVSLMDYWLICPTTHFLNSEGEICSKSSSMNCWKCLSWNWFNSVGSRRSVRGHILPKIFQAYGVNRIAKRTVCIKRSLKCADKLIAPSETIIKFFTKNGFIEGDDLKGGNVVLLHHGVDTCALSKVRKTPSKNIRFGYIGSFEERKGLLVLVEAFNALGNANAELKIYGASKLDPSNKYKKCLIEKSRTNPRIKFMGQFEDVVEPYSNIDVLVVPSISFEGYGLVVQEAFATNTPVICSNIGALNEFVEHMKNGLLFQVGNANDLTRKMLLIIENPHLLSQLKSKMPPVKSIEKNAEEIEAVYEEIAYGKNVR